MRRVLIAGFALCLPVAAMSAESTTPVLNNYLDANATSLKLDDSFGVDAQVGVDYSIGNDWFLNAEVRWLDIDSDATISADGVVAVTDTVSIDPFAYALSVGRKS